MKLTTLIISGFQSFGESPTYISVQGVSYLLGPNGSGKTAVLHALARMFAVDPLLRGVRPSDFHVPSPGAPDRTASQATDRDAAEPEGVEPNTDVSGVTAEGARESKPDSEPILVRPRAPRGLAELWIEAEFTLEEDSEGDDSQAAVPEFLFQMRLDEVDGPMRVRIRLTATRDSADEVEERLEFVLARDENGNPTKVQPVSGYARRRIQLHYLPAKRDPKEQISYAPRSLLGNALRAASWQAENETIQAWNGEITSALAKNPAIDAIGKALAKNWGELHKSEYYAAPTIGFGQSDLDLLLRQLTINFGPNPQGATSTFDMLSDGQQSLLYLTTVLALHEVGRSLLSEGFDAFSEEKYGPAVFTLLAFEEPENSLSPFYLGRVLKLLKTSAAQPDCQALIATHAPSVVKRVSPEQIRFLRLDGDRCTQVRPIPMPSEDDEAHKYVQQAVAAYPELYFARLVILGEGASEEVFLPRLLSAGETGADAHSVAVVPLGGRHVNHMWRLLNGIGIPHLTLLDLDRCRYGGGWGRVRTAVANLKEFSGEPRIKTQLADVAVKQIPGWKEQGPPPAEQSGSWLEWLESANVFFSSPLDLDFLLLEHYRDSYMNEDEAPEGDTSDASLDPSDAQQPPLEHEVLSGAAGAPLETGRPSTLERVVDETLAKQVLGRKGLDPTSSYTPTQLAMFPQYRALFQLGSKPAAHLVALSRLTDDQLLTGLPPVMSRLLERASELLDQYGE